MHGLLLPRLAGDRAGAGVVLAGTRTGVAGGVVAELTEHPGAEDVSEPRLAAVDLSVRVLPKMGLDLLLHGLDLGAQGSQDRYLGLHGHRVGRADPLGLAQMLGAQRRPDPRGLVLDLAASGVVEGGGDPPG